MIKPTFEQVYTVYDFYDGPRSGFADFEGRPHAFRALWNEGSDDWDEQDRFALSPITADTLNVALEDWAIWRRWEEAYFAGLTPMASHPALPEDRARHDALAPAIARALEFDASHASIAIGRFRSRTGPRGGLGIPTSRAELEVQWTPVTSVSNAI